MLRVLRPGGLLIWFDYLFDNPNNKDVRGIRMGEIRRLFPGCDVRLKRTVLAPPLARRIAPISTTFASMLGAIPWLCTHYIGAVEKPFED